MNRRIRLSHRNCDRATMRALRIQKKCKPIINAADAQRFSKYAYRLRSRSALLICVYVRMCCTVADACRRCYYSIAFSPLLNGCKAKPFYLFSVSFLASFVFVRATHRETHTYCILDTDSILQQ